MHLYAQVTEKKTTRPLKDAKNKFFNKKIKKIHPPLHCRQSGSWVVGGWSTTATVGTEQRVEGLSAVVEPQQPLSSDNY